MIQRKRLTATLEGNFVLFLIGMRINEPLKVHKWLPVAAAMPRMIKELHRNPDMGFLHSETWFARTIIVVQYWRSMEQLLAYARNKDTQHLPAWQAFNRHVGTNGSVGIWHEAYEINPGGYENIYVNMPLFGLAKAGVVSSATGDKRSAFDRLNKDSNNTKHSER